MILQTERLMLRRLEPSDLDDLYALYRDPETRRYFPDGTRTYEQTAEELAWFEHGHPRHPELGLWATILKESGQFVGRCGLLPWTIEGRQEVEIAYMIAKPFWRQGLGAEVARSLVAYGFDKLDLESLIALIDPDHEASLRTARSAGLEFDFETVMDGLRTVVYRVRRSEPKRHQARSQVWGAGNKEQE
jgi:ribosomal-protein-alanine N-acetyltransferase